MSALATGSFDDVASQYHVNEHEINETLAIYCSGNKKGTNSYIRVYLLLFHGPFMVGSKAVMRV